MSLLRKMFHTYLRVCFFFLKKEGHRKRNIYTLEYVFVVVYGISPCAQAKILEVILPQNQSSMLELKVHIITKTVFKLKLSL